MKQLGWRGEGENFDTRKSNAIWAFTPGKFNKSWLSDKAVNEQMLIEKGGDFDWGLKHTKPIMTMTIAVPSWAKNVIYAKGIKMEKFLIKLFDAQDGSVYPTPLHTIVFHHIEIIAPVVDKNFDKLPGGAAANYREVYMSINAGVDYY